MREPPRRRSVPDPQPARRTVLRLAVVVGLSLPRVGISGAQDDERRKARPQPDDRLVFAGGDRKGQLITLTDLPAGGPPLTAYPMDPTARVVRDDSRLNQILLVRLDARPYVTQEVFTKIDPVTGRPSYNEERKPRSGASVTFCPGLWGGKDWTPPGYNPKTQYLYIPAHENLCSTLVGQPKPDPYEPGKLYLGIDRPKTSMS